MSLTMRWSERQTAVRLNYSLTGGKIALPYCALIVTRLSRGDASSGHFHFGG